MTRIPLLAAALVLALAGCADTPTEVEKHEERVAHFKPAATAKALKADLERRGHTVGRLTCEDVAKDRQTCAGTVNGEPVRWKVTLDLATGERDAVVVP
jgi:hypothetical protein